jgi:hypothetical protein
MTLQPPAGNSGYYNQQYNAPSDPPPTYGGGYNSGYNSGYGYGGQEAGVTQPQNAYQPPK